MSCVILLGGADTSDVTASAANVDSGKKFIDVNGDLITGTSNKIYTQAQYNANYNSGRTQGRNDVTSEPSSYSLCSAYYVVLRLSFKYVKSDATLRECVMNFPITYTGLDGSTKSLNIGAGNNTLYVKPDSNIVFNSWRVVIQINWGRTTEVYSTNVSQALNYTLEAENNRIYNIVVQGGRSGTLSLIGSTGDGYLYYPTVSIDNQIINEYRVRY